MTKQLGKIEVIEYQEQDDGSAIVTIDCDADARRLLISEGFVALVAKALDKHNVEYDYLTARVTDEDNTSTQSSNAVKTEAVDE
jgi:hypothetical protein